jgi:cysteine synthase B
MTERSTCGAQGNMTMWTRDPSFLDAFSTLPSRADFADVGDSERKPVQAADLLVRALDIEQQIGNTPLLCFPRITAHLPPRVRLYAKAEWLNPGGSVKDRAALNIVKYGEISGALTRDKIILDSTSGNTGIAYAMIGAAMGYRVKLFMSQNVSPEHVAILRALGADIGFTDPQEGSDGAMMAVRDLYAREPEGYFYGDQYNNPANWQAHYQGTGVEIWHQTRGTITHFVAGLGTSGTFVGTGRRLKQYNPAIRLIALQPDAAIHKLEGLKHMDSAIKPGIYDAALADDHLDISTEAAQAMARRLAREEGYMVGTSSGAALVGALRVAEDLAKSGQAGVVVTLLPDNAYKYLSESYWRQEK